MPVIKIIKSASLSLSLPGPLSFSVTLASLSLSITSCSLTHTFASLNGTGLSPKPLIHVSDPRLRSVLHLNAHLTPIRPLLWFSAVQTHLPQTHFSYADQTHADTVLPKPQATVATHLSIIFAVIEFFFF